MSHEPAVLELVDVTAGYRGATVLRDVSFEVRPGELVALLGANGAGKTTTLRVAAGLLRPTDGTVRVFGSPERRARPHRRAQQGVCLIPEGRGIFRSLSVRENLRLHTAAHPGRASDGLDRALTAFPALRNRLEQAAGQLSGGEQQMLALARAYATNPKVILLDEVSLGLAPKIVDEIFHALEALKSTGVAMLLVEQYVQRALALADRVLLMQRGAITYNGSPAGLDRDDVMASYLGGEPDDRTTHDRTTNN